MIKNLKRCLAALTAFSALSLATLSGAHAAVSDAEETYGIKTAYSNADNYTKCLPCC